MPFDLLNYVINNDDSPSIAVIDSIDLSILGNGKWLVFLLNSGITDVESFIFWLLDYFEVFLFDH